jgi:orotate phosphoribosyltransferase
MYELEWRERERGILITKNRGLIRYHTLASVETSEFLAGVCTASAIELTPLLVPVSTSPYAASLISLSLSSSQPILRFGSFTLKSGRLSPYFFNFGLFNSGSLLLSLTEAYTDAILDSFPLIGTPEAPEDYPSVLFGPAYKGIPLVAAISTELARRGRDVGFSYNRKEAKAHGEGGSIVGTPLKGKNVLIVDDVITAGTAIREAHKIVEGEGGKTSGIVEALDREEKGQGELSTVQEVEQALGVKVTSVVKMRDIVSWLKEQGKEEECKAMQEYRAKWGVN